MARNPEKLRSLLTSQAHGVSESIMSRSLRIVQGDVKDAHAVRRTLVMESGRAAEAEGGGSSNTKATFSSSSSPSSSSFSPSNPASASSTSTADIIIFGVGGAPRLTPFSVHLVTVDDPHVCGEGMKTVLEVLESIRAASLRRDAGAGAATVPTFKKPFVAAISTTGLPLTGGSGRGGRRDVPLPLLPLYRWLLAVPHQDKLEMERALLLLLSSSASSSDGGGLVDAVVVRPTLLVDGERSGREKVRVGWERVGGGGGDGGRVGPGPAVGYSVRRADVGEWLYEEVVMGRTNDAREWAGRVVTLSN